MAGSESQKRVSFREYFSFEALVDWLAPIIVVVVIGGMLFALIGAILAPAE